MHALHACPTFHLLCVQDYSLLELAPGVKPKLQPHVNRSELYVLTDWIINFLLFFFKLVLDTQNYDEQTEEQAHTHAICITMTSRLRSRRTHMTYV